MAKVKGRSILTPSSSKKTSQGNGKFSKSPSAGGEAFTGTQRRGSPPSKARRRKKPYRGQGK